MIKTATHRMACVLVLLVVISRSNYGTTGDIQNTLCTGEITVLTHDQLPQRLLQKVTYTGDYTIHAKGGELILEPLSAPLEGRHYILQFNSTIQPEWIKELVNAGVVFHWYVPPLAYFISADNAAFYAAKTKYYVRGIGIFPSTLKIDPVIYDTKLTKTLSETSDTVKEIKSGIVRIILFNDSDVTTVKTWIESSGGRVVAVNQESHSILVATSTVSLEEVAQLDDVMFIELYREPHLCLDTSQGIVKSVVPVAGGFDGTGVLVSVIDTGYDYTHPDFPGSVIALDYTETDTADGVAEDMHGHGTHTASTVLGRGTAAYTGFWGPFGRVPRGIAPAAALMVQRVFDDDGAWGAGTTTVFQLMMDALINGAHISSNSWGSFSFGAYTQDCVEADQTVILGLNEVFAAGNFGLWGIDSPGSAKNVITVGASENYEQDAWFSGTWPAIDPDMVLGFSAAGYTQDDRVKPDVMAPGSWVLAGRTTLRDPYTYWGASTNEPERYSCYYAYNGGTSMSTPTVAGCAADILEAWGTNTPPSFVKALFINTAECMDYNGNGVPDGFYYYDQWGAPVLPWVDYGWGRINVMNALYDTPTHDIQGWVMEDAPLLQGEGYYINDFVVPAGMILKVTLVWTDDPGNPAVIPQLVNDLDLFVADTVEGPPAVWWQGNIFDPVNPLFSLVNPPGADTINNVEQVIIQGTGASVDIVWWAPSIPGGLFDRYAVVLSLDEADPYAPVVVDFNGGATQTQDNHFGVLSAAANQTVTVDIYESKGHLGGGMPSTVTLHYALDGGPDNTIVLNSLGGSGIVTYSTSSLDLSAAGTRVDFWVEGADLAGNKVVNGGQELNSGSGGYKYTLYVQDVVGPDCRGIDPWPHTPLYTAVVPVTAYIYENVAMGTEITVNYAVNGGTPHTAVLTGLGGSGYMVYTGTIDLTSFCSGYIDMWVSGEDTALNPITSCVVRNTLLDKTGPIITAFEPTDGCILPNSPMLWAEATLYETCSMPPTVMLNWATNPVCVLLVDDDTGSPDVESFYQDAITAAGFGYFHWDVEVLGEPTAADMALYDTVIWFTGYDWWTTLSPADEAALSTYITGGGTLFLSSQDYLWDKGLTAFGTTYLKINSYTNDVGTDTITGVTGDPISHGLGTLGLDYPFFDFSDTVHPGAAGAPVFFNDSAQPCGIRAVDGSTLFFGFPFEAIDTALHRGIVMGKILTYLTGTPGSVVTSLPLTGPGGTGGVYTMSPLHLDLTTTSPGDTVVFWVTGTDDANNFIAGGSLCAALSTVTMGSGVGVPYTIVLTKTPPSIPPDGKTASYITAAVLDSTGAGVPGVTVTFSTTHGIITPSAVTNAQGIATAILTSTVPRTATVTGKAVGSTGICVWHIYNTTTITCLITGRTPSSPFPSLCPLAHYNIEQTQILKKEAETLLANAQEQGKDTTAAEELMKKAEEYLKRAVDFCIKGSNCIAGNWNALKAMELYNQAIDELEKLQ